MTSATHHLSICEERTLIGKLGFHRDQCTLTHAQQRVFQREKNSTSLFNARYPKKRKMIRAQCRILQKVLEKTLHPRRN